jgi:hypothetical protein
MTQPTEETDYGFDLQDLELAQEELTVALFFADYSSSAFSHGKLRHAIDARSKARSLCNRASARLKPAGQHVTAK